MRLFACGIFTTILVLFALVGVVSLAGVNVELLVDAPLPTETVADSQPVASGGS